MLQISIVLRSNFFSASSDKTNEFRVGKPNQLYQKRFVGFVALYLERILRGKLLSERLKGSVF